MQRKVITSNNETCPRIFCSRYSLNQPCCVVVFFWIPKSSFLPKYPSVLFSRKTIGLFSFFSLVVVVVLLFISKTLFSDTPSCSTPCPQHPEYPSVFFLQTNEWFVFVCCVVVVLVSPKVFSTNNPWCLCPQWPLTLAFTMRFPLCFFVNRFVFYTKFPFTWRRILLSLLR